MNEERKVLLEALRREKLKGEILSPDEIFTHQRACIVSKVRYKAVLCGRRAGKTEKAARAIVIALLDSGRDEWVIFGAKTKGQARDIIWQKLKGVIERHGLDRSWKLNELGTIETPAGATFKLVGFDDAKDMEKMRGYKVRLAIFDEVASYEEFLPKLLKDIVRYALADLRGTLVLMGTPGYARAGEWFLISTGQVQGWETFHWTIRNNPFFPDPEGYIKEECELWGWTEQDPSFRREMLGEWVSDDSMLVYPYHSTVALPRDWSLDDAAVTMGIDYGKRDATAWVVTASRRGDPRAYILYAYKERELLPDQVATITKKIAERFRPMKAVGDPGGGGTFLMDDFNHYWGRDLGVYLDVADKHDRKGSIAMLNADLKMGRFVIVECDETRDLVEEMQRLPWKENRKEEHPLYDNHLCDALRYCHRAHVGIMDNPETEKRKGRSTTEDEAHREMLETMENMRREQEEREEWDGYL